MPESSQISKYSPLSGLTGPAGGIELRQRAFIGKVNLRGDSGDEGFRAGVEAALGVGLPPEANTTSANEDYTIFWLGPNEWLIHCAEEKQHATVTGLRESLSGQHIAVTDVTDYYLVIRLTGDKAREVLSKGSPFDTDPDQFGAGKCAQTVFGHASVLLHCLGDRDGYDVQVRWSFAEYLWNYLVNGSREYG